MSRIHKNLAMFLAIFVIGGLAQVGIGSVVIDTSEGTGADALIRHYSLYDGLDNSPADWGILRTTYTESDQGWGNGYVKSYIRFDLTAADELGTVSGATLKLTTSNIPSGNKTFEIYGLVDGDPDAAWSEGTLTWNNALGALGNADAAAMDPTHATLLETLTDVSLTQDTTWSISLGAAALNFINADTDNSVTLMIVQSAVSTGDVEFYSGEDATASNRPQLELVPEPGAVVLLGIGGVAALVRRKRK